MRDRKVEVLECSGSKLVRAAENSSRSCGHRETQEAPPRDVSPGWRVLPPPTRAVARVFGSHGLRRGLFSFALRAFQSPARVKFLFAALLLPALAGAAIWPDAIGAYHKTSTPQAALSDRPVWEEYGLKTSEAAVYEGDGKRFTATAYQLQDSTSGLAAFDWQRDSRAAPSKAASLAAETPDTLLVAYGNYLLLFNGYKPTKPELDAVTAGLLNVDGTGLPTLPGYLPSDSLVPNSERYIIGPEGLQKFAPGIPPSVAAFHMGAEAQLGVFHSRKGPIALAIFNYPTNQMAMQRIGEFEKLPGAVAKRSGPLVAVILAPADPDAAERLLAQVRYEAVVTQNEYVPSRRDNIGNLVINAFILTAILAVFCVVSGLAVGVFWAVRRRGKHGVDAAGMIVLNLEGR